jgi:hypothetical protein
MIIPLVVDAKPCLAENHSAFPATPAIAGPETTKARTGRAFVAYRLVKT